MPEEVRRAEQLELLKALRSISPQGSRGLAMLAKGVQLVEELSGKDEEDADVTGSLISYCVRDAIDSIFPKLNDPKIKDAAQRLVRHWRSASARPGTDLGLALHDDFTDLKRAVDAATAGFLPRVSGLLGVLHPGLPADLGIPAMTRLRDLNNAANGGLHGSTTRDDAVALLDGVLERLVDLIAPLAVTAQQYQALIDADDFQGVASLLTANSDPRIRVYLFDRVRDPLLAQTLDIAELLPGSSLWLAYGYVRHLAEDDIASFSAFVDRVAVANRLTPEIAGQLLICASFAGPDAASEVDRLSRKAKGKVRVELVALWLRNRADAVTEASWWRILTRIVGELRLSERQFQAPHGVDEVLELAIARMPGIAAQARSRFSVAVVAALGRLEAKSPYAVQFHFDNQHLRARTMSDLLIEAAVRVVATAQSRGESVGLTALSDRSRVVIERAAVAQAIEMATPDLGVAIAVLAFDSVIDRMNGEEWPDLIDRHILRVVVPLLGPTAVARISGALGEPPLPSALREDLDSASEVRAGWFRTAQWAAHLPEDARPASWVAALGESARHGITFGPPPPADQIAWPSDHDTPFGDVDIPGTTVAGFVALLNSTVRVGEPDDPRFAMNAHETITGHAATHREAWASDHEAIALIRDLWARLAVVRALKSEANDLPRLRWEQLQVLWSSLVAEVSGLAGSGNEAAKPAVSRLATELLEHLRHRVSERPRQASDIDWWAQEVLPAIVPMLAWIGGEEHDFGMPALFSVRGETVRLLIALSSPIDEDVARDAALGRSLDLLGDVAMADPGFARSVGHWARWLIRRDPAWWDRYVDLLIGSRSAPQTREALLKGNWDSRDVAVVLLDRDVALLNAYASQPTEDAAAPALMAVLFDVLPISAIEQSTWSAMFRDGSAAEMALRYVFPDRPIDEDVHAVRRLEMLRWVATDAYRASMIWASVDVLAASPDLDDEDLFTFTAGLAGSNRGAPRSTYHFADRLVRSLTRPDAVATLEAMCAGNLGSNRAMAQYDMGPVNAWFRGDGQRLPADLRTRVQHALFEIGFVNADPE